MRRKRLKLLRLLPEDGYVEEDIEEDEKNFPIMRVFRNGLIDSKENADPEDIETHEITPFGFFQRGYGGGVG